MSASAGTGVFMLSLMSIPICYLFNSLIYSNSAEAFFFAGCTTVLILAISARFMLKKKAPVDPLFYVYAVNAFLSVVNLIVGLEQDNIIDGFVTFYLREADPHVNTAHGHMISYWDGCVHYLMYLLMIAAITWGDSYRAIGLYWVGSFLMRAMVYILGNAVGKYGTHVGPLFILHILYISLSVWACFRILTQPSTRDVELTDIEEAQRTGLLHRHLDLVFIIYLIPALAFCVFRGLAQFSHIGASLHTRTPFSYRVPVDSQPVFLLVNVLYTLVPQVLCYRCCTQPAFFLKTTPEKKGE
ncbi:transmembrane 6 superfamily member 1 isoform X2 [Archocentrus centrarchus]|uniref:transmembrane 6 superfamily member 1 isoform X2 n=1 Tax=Archocentrus centrarchus TaxID=63155 RepID=UPI0011E9B418|nr:transmembrane 6 superfamily member 1 isoform X2 [Archocentrus centrarchus]